VISTVFSIPFPRFHYLLFVPLKESDFDIFVLADQLPELVDIAETVFLPVMVREDDFRLERQNGGRRLLDRHGAGQVHTYKCIIDILEVPHLGNIFRIS
jgi:hypothetical protein